MQPIFPLLVLLLAAAAPAQSLFPFTIDQDRLSGVPDFSYLNHPLTSADRVTIKDGHFYTASGDRVRFFGVNLAFGANFPVQADAVRIARRLRRLGVNLVRLHHMDSQPDSNPANANSVLTTGPYPSFNDVAIQRLRGFLTALAAEGIYADLNLHVGYQFRPAIDQIPALSGQSIPTQSKPLHIFHPRMVELQQQYTLQLIQRLELRNDPVLALVEVNNESSLLHEWQSGMLDPVLTGEYRSALQSRWNGFLAAKYRATDALKTAWGAASSDGPELLKGQWTLEQGHGKTGSLTMVQMDGIPTAQVQPGPGSGWLFLKQTGFHVSKGIRYLWTFEARADLPAGQTVNVPLSVMRDVSPWDGISYQSINLSNQWQTFAIAVTPSFDIEDSGRVSLDVEYAPGNVYARKMSLVQAGQRALAVGESIESGNIGLITPREGATPARLADYTAFIIDTDRAYVNAVRDSVRTATDHFVPVTGTQMGYGGLGILDSQEGLDFQDNHFYVDHYNFPNTAWDGFDWRIRDASAADNNWSSFLDMAWAREAGRPYTVSEFNQPWPNTHAAEIDPALAAFAAFQDWDGIMHFAYSHGRGWDDNVPNGFNINGDWSKFSVIGQSAWIFRTGAVKPGSLFEVPVSAADRLQSASSGQSITSWVAGRVPKEKAFTSRVQLNKENPPGQSGPIAPGDLTFDTASKMLLLNAPAAAGAFGRLGIAKTTAGAIDIELAAPAASVLLTALDGRPIHDSRRLFLSIPGYTLRSLPRTAGPQALLNYRGTTDWWTIDPANSSSASKPSGDLNAGSRPTYMQAVEAWITVRMHGGRIVVSALDGSGRVAGVLAETEVQPVAGGFRIHLNGPGQPQSPWFTISALPSRPR